MPKKLAPNSVKRISRAVRAFERNGEPRGGKRRRRRPRDGADGFYIRINSAAAIVATTNRWKYGWIEQQLDKLGVFKDLPGGRQSTDMGDSAHTVVDGFNTLEHMNSDTGMQGNGVTVPLPEDATFDHVPTNGTVVVWGRLRRNCDDVTEMLFTYPNPVTMNCPAGPPP